MLLVPIDTHIHGQRKIESRFIHEVHHVLRIHIRVQSIEAGEHFKEASWMGSKGIGSARLEKAVYVATHIGGGLPRILDGPRSNQSANEDGRWYLPYSSLPSRQVFRRDLHHQRIFRHCLSSKSEAPKHLVSTPIAFRFIWSRQGTHCLVLIGSRLSSTGGGT